jgi:hypothetical protein
MWHIAADVPECHSMQTQPVPGRRQARGVSFTWSLLTLVAAAVAGWPAATLAAPKTDVVELNNGDRITCEIKSLEHNRLKVSTDYMGSVYLEWDEIRSVQTNQYFLLELTDGSRVYGQLAPSDANARLQVTAVAGTPPRSLDMAVVVRAQPIEGGSFIDRLDGYVSAGLDLSESGDNTSMDFAGGLSSRTQIREWNIDGSANVTDDGEERTERYQLGGVSRRILRGPYYYEGMLGFTRNTELDLNLRSMFGGGVGRYFVRTNRAEWLGGVGLAYSHENYQAQDPTNSLELLLGTQFSIFRYDFPETDIGGSLVVLPSLTESGRYRSEADLHAKYEFVDDLYFELRMYGSYDSAPPGDDAPSSDYGFVTSLGYKF